ncbi:MAG: DUF5684 domain-containing protein [Spirochaetes bacterium]|jgi:hypothetical protein|nr:DUF5684 domain-containing protein [Spirochaetota bacterium]
MSQGGGGSVVGSLIYLAIIILVIAGLWKIFVKAGKPGWAAIVPIYNLIVMIQIAGKPIWWIILMIIPLVNFIVFILIWLEIIKKFGQPTWHVILVIFVGFVYIPYLGFSDVAFKG